MVTIIGAGPSGNYCAYLLSRGGKEVRIFEENKEIGKPIQCTGIVTSAIKDIIKVDKNTILNEIEKADIFSPDGKSIGLNLKNKNLILDREKFDNYLAEIAIGQGTKIFLNYKFMDYKNNKIKLRYKNNDQFIEEPTQLVGADGPLSQVAKSANLFGKRKFMTGFQVRLRLRNENHVEFYPFIGNFAWIVPENKEIVRLGVASYTDIRTHFNNLLKLKRISENQIIEKQGGLIPLFNPKLKIQKNNTYLLGDAASQVKATTGGGIVQGLIGAECLGESILKGKSYEKRCKNRLNKELNIHLRARKILDKFKPEDLNKLTKIFNKEKNKHVIETFDRDHLSKFIFQLTLKEPKLLYFLKYIV